MKRLPLYLCLLLAACNSPKGDNAEAGDKQEVLGEKGTRYTLDSSSTITWAASKPTQTHTGTFRLQQGTFDVIDNQVSRGNFIIDITSIKNMDLSDADGKQKLEAHLKSPDFFNIEKFPRATFEITKVEAYTDSTGKASDATHYISGNLTLRDSTKNIRFPARITIDDRSLTTKADFNIDRTMWGMNYKGPGNPQDWFISKEVNLKLDLTASKK